MKISKCFLVALLAIGAAPCLYGQDTTPADSTLDVTELSLEDLMSVKIVSASRKEEKAFDAPLSSFVLTKKEIINSGATSIPEALRLCPGLFVKQMYNGVYDVTIRGFDNLSTHDARNTNKLLLVMINNRPVFDYHNGGTFWQDLPVDLIDINRIEVVLGPSSPLYGPNAVAGVINILTINPDKDGVSASAHVQGGTPDTYIGQGMVGYQVNPKFNVTGSVNYQTRGRHTVEYYDPNKRTFITDITKVPATYGPGTTDLSPIFPDFERAVKKVAGNIVVNYKPSEEVNLHLTGGFTNSNALYGFSAGNPVSATATDTRYGMLKGEVKGFSFLVSSVSGTQKIASSKYNLMNSDLYLDYTLKVSDKFNLRPAVNYQHSVVSDKDFTKAPYTPVFRGLREMYNLGLSLKADYSVGKLRFIGAIRGDKFKYPNDWYVSYQGIANYKLNENHILRAIVARSNGGSFMEGTYLNIGIFIPANGGNPYSINLNLLGNKDRKLTVNNLFEIGYRGQLSKNLQMDLAMFFQVIDGFVASINQVPIVNNAQMNITINSVRQNLDLFAEQKGATLGINWWLLNTRLNIKPYVTLQSSRLYHYSPYYSVPASNVNYNTETQQNVDGKGTPKVYGGFYANYAPTGKWNLNLNGYYMSKYEIYSNTSATGNGPYNEHEISKLGDKFILNARVGYLLTQNFNVFVNARNLFNNNGREFFATDKIGAMYMGGINFVY